MVEAPGSAEGQPVLRVVATLLERRRADGVREFMAAQRPAHKARGGQWEFPGGKVEPGESESEALTREGQEELGCTIASLGALASHTHRYPELTVTVVLHRARLVEGEPQALEAQALRWAEVEQLLALPFCEADRAFFEAVRAEARRP